MSDWAPPSGPEPAPEPLQPPAAGWQPVPTAPPATWSTPPQWTPGPGGWQPYAPPPAPKPGVIPLRPLGVGELLDGAFTVIRRYTGATLGFAAILMLVVQTVQVLSNYLLLSDVHITTTSSPNGFATTTTQTRDLAAYGATGIVTLLITVLASLVLTGVVTAVVGDGVLGRSITAGEAWRRLRPVFARLFGVSLVTWLIIVGAWLVCVLPGFILFASGSRDGGIALMAVGFFAGFVLAAYFWTMLSLTPAAVVLERQTVRSALRRSRALVRGSWWRVFLILVLTFIISTIVSGIITVPFGIAGGTLTILRGDMSNGLSFTALLLNGIGGLIAGTIVRPFTAGVTALLYIDRRMRAEALDMTLQSAAAAQ